VIWEIREIRDRRVTPVARDKPVTPVRREIREERERPVEREVRDLRVERVPLEIPVIRVAREQLVRLVAPDPPDPLAQRDQLVIRVQLEPLGKLV